MTTQATICRCGRLKGGPKPHCPYCGSLWVHGKVTAAETVDRVRYRGFRCRSCGMDFHEGLECQAPIQPPKKKRLTRQEAEEAANRAIAEGVLANPANERLAEYLREQMKRLQQAEPRVEGSIDQDGGPDV